jgi:hypothetical protein
MTAKGPERIDKMVNTLRTWQALERVAMTETSELAAKTKSPLIRMIMEIIGHDSQMHHRVQQFLIDDLEKQSVTVTREDVAEIWDKIEQHDKVEKKTIELAKAMREEAWSPVHRQMLDYLLADEAKHDSLLAQLEEVKRGMSKASGG